MRRWLVPVLLAAGWLAGCQVAQSAGDPPEDSREPLRAPAVPPDADDELARCEARWSEVAARPAAPGAPAFDAQRVAFLGRARGASTVFVRPPAPTPDDALASAALAERARLAREAPGYRVARLVGRHTRDKETLRALLLREGYLYADDPQDAFELESRVTLTDLFDAPVVLLERGGQTSTLERAGGRFPSYQVKSGPEAGQTARIFFGDRVSLPEEVRSQPLHRDVLGFAREAGFDRMTLEHLTEGDVLTRLRFGETWARAVVRADGAHLSIACLAEPRAVREGVAAFLAREAPRRRALAALRGAITATVGDALPFDRPRDVKGPDRDGELRPYWMSAYLGGRHGFEVDGQTYAVFDLRGRPAPPTVCVDFVLDTWERASGRWYRPRGEKPGKTPGRLDLGELGIENRRGVMGLLSFAESRPELFEVLRVPAAERVPFAERARFFAGLGARSEDLRPGDILAIQGIKKDDRVHQHAILLEDLDPLTGFPSELADQMRVPRRRSWEGIMAEAPRRSWLYRIRPRDALLLRLDPEGAAQPD